MNILDLPQDQFIAALGELGLDAARRDELMRMKREKDSPLGGLLGASAADPGMVRASILPMMRPEGMSGLEALTSGEASLAVPGFLTGLLSETARAVDAPRAAYEGQIPMQDMASEAGTLAGLLALGATGGAGRGVMDYDPSVVGMNLGGLYNALGRISDEDLAAATPFRRTGAENFSPRREDAGRAKDPALYTDFSSVKQDQVAPYDWEVTGRRLGTREETPTQMTAEDIGRQFDVLYGYPADATLNNVIIDSINGRQLPTPILQQAGHTFPDRPGLGFASEMAEMAKRNKVWREAQREGLRVGVSPMVMGAKGGDFSQHVGQTQAQLIRAAEGEIDPNYMPPKLPQRAAENLTGLLDPRLPYVLESLVGGERGAFLKALDNSPALRAGVPSVAATRWATMDPNLIGADMLSSGYRIFEPAPSDAVRRYGEGIHSTYTGHVNRVGPSMTMGEPRPWYLMYPDIAYASMEKATKPGANMLRLDALPKDLRKFQMNPRLRQETDQEWVDANMRFDDILAQQGREAANMSAYDALLARANRRAR
jgi:hypothetical protein